MYLSRRRIGNKTHYSIRHSYAADEIYKSRHLFDLGSDPRDFINYPGGHGYYFAPIIEETLVEKGVRPDPIELDEIFFEFLRPDIQRVISDFDRRKRNASHKSRPETPPQEPVHVFDKRRYHFLRFGPRQRQHIQRVPLSTFGPLQQKSRDEMEHYFWEQERRLPSVEKAIYARVIFELNRWSPAAEHEYSWGEQLDLFFTEQLCKLNADREFMSGVAEFSGLSAYLIRYVIYFFDFAPPHRSAEHEYIRDFINRHRIHRPPASVQIKMDEAEKLFASSWKALQKMDRKQLTKRYRRQALKHHPDQGGDPEVFRRLTQYYHALLSRKPRNPQKG